MHYFSGRKKAIIANPRLDMCSRQVYMYDEFKDLVDIFKIRDHFICNIYSQSSLFDSKFNKLKK